MRVQVEPKSSSVSKNNRGGGIACVPLASISSTSVDTGNALKASRRATVSGETSPSSLNGSRCSNSFLKQLATAASAFSHVIVSSGDSPIALVDCKREKGGCATSQQAREVAHPQIISR